MCLCVLFSVIYYTWGSLNFWICGFLSLVHFSKIICLCFFFPSSTFVTPITCLLNFEIVLSQNTFRGSSKGQHLHTSLQISSLSTLIMGKIWYPGNSRKEALSQEYHFPHYNKIWRALEWALWNHETWNSSRKFKFLLNNLLIT